MAGGVQLSEDAASGEESAPTTPSLVLSYPVLRCDCTGLVASGVRWTTFRLILPVLAVSLAQTLRAWMDLAPQ